MLILTKIFEALLVIVNMLSEHYLCKHEPERINVSFVIDSFAFYFLWCSI